MFGVGLAAFRYPSKLWASFLISIALGAMVVGSLGAVFHRGLPRNSGRLRDLRLALLAHELRSVVQSGDFTVSFHDSVP